MPLQAVAILTIFPEPLLSPEGKRLKRLGEFQVRLGNEHYEVDVFNSADSDGLYPFFVRNKMFFAAPGSPCPVLQDFEHNDIKPEQLFEMFHLQLV